MTTQLAKQDVPMAGGIVQFQSASDALYFADQVFRSGLAPSGFKSAQAIFVAVQQGAELGMKPMQSLQGIAVINGKTSLYDKTARGLALSSGKVASIDDHFEGSNDDLTAICTIHRFTQGMQQAQFIGKFSVSDAKRAGLWGKAGPWTAYPKDMLSHKASSRALNAGFADVLIGLPVFEDIQDSPPERKPSENPNPVEDPLMKQVPSIRQLMEEKAANPTRNGASMTGEDNAGYNQTNNHSIGRESEDLSRVPSGFDSQDSSEPASESLEIHPDDLDYKTSVSENGHKANDAVESTSREVPAGAQSVTGEMIVYAPKTEKQPWNIVISGVKMAVWKKTLPAVVAQFEKGNLGKGKIMRGDYTSEQKGQYTNNTCVHLEQQK